MDSFAVFALVLLAALVGNGSALLCRNCVSSLSFENCEATGAVQQCNATIVNTNHAFHYENNPSLPQGNGTEFKCYRVQMARLYLNGTDSGVRQYARGCTFNTTNFCSGWLGTVNVTSCGTCMTDNCDQNPALPTESPATTTTAPVVTTTTVSPAVTTTANPGGSTSTTKKPSNGAGTVIHHGMTTLALASVLALLVVQ